jgi:hypothetical protein
MTFQFLCPGGHLLQGDELQAGRRCKRPYCGSEFLVPPACGNSRFDRLPIARGEPGGGPVAGMASPSLAPGGSLRGRAVKVTGRQGERQLFTHSPLHALTPSREGGKRREQKLGKASSHWAIATAVVVVLEVVVLVVVAVYR